jgi:hypothetical protein
LTDILPIFQVRPKETQEVAFLGSFSPKCILADSNRRHGKILNALRSKDEGLVRAELKKDSWKFGKKLSRYLLKKSCLKWTFTSLCAASFRRKTAPLTPEPLRIIFIFNTSAVDYPFF